MGTKNFRIDHDSTRRAFSNIASQFASIAPARLGMVQIPSPRTLPLYGSSPRRNAASEYK